jgi:hypothetical protein
MPQSVKYLILAAYIASSNPKESDIHSFGTGKRGRRKASHSGGGRKGRKKHRVVVEGDDDEQPSTTLGGAQPETIESNPSRITYDTFGRVTGDSTNASCVSSPRCFGLERLFGLFAHVACFCGLQALSVSEQASLALGQGTGVMSKLCKCMSYRVNK